MQGNLENKFTVHGTKPLGLQGGQVGLEKHTKTYSLPLTGIDCKPVACTFHNSDHEKTVRTLSSCTRSKPKRKDDRLKSVLRLFYPAVVAEWSKTLISQIQ